VRRPAVLALVLAAAGLAGCGPGQRVSPLEWQGRPLSVTPPDLPTDHVVIGQVRNTSIRSEFRVDAAALKVVDASGRPVQAHAQFIASYAHGLYGAYQKPPRQETSELLRLGIKLRLKPGRAAPLYVAYRTRPGLKLPLHVRYPRGTLSLPG
jgi:hypothetical protein